MATRISVSVNRRSNSANATLRSSKSRVTETRRQRELEKQLVDLSLELSDKIERERQLLKLFNTDNENGQT